MLAGACAATLAFIRIAIALCDRARNWGPAALLAVLGGVTLEIYLVQGLFL